MPVVPGEFDANYGLQPDEAAAVAALANDKEKKKPAEPPEELEDRRHEEDAAAATAEADEHAAATELAEIEEKARSMGWVPLAEFTGNKDRWRDAKDWLGRGYANPYILKTMNDRLEEDRKRSKLEIEALKAKLDEFTQVVRSINSRFEAADRNGYNRAVAEAKARQKEAVGEADTDKYDKATADLEALTTQGPPKALPEPAANGDARRPPEIDPEIAAWTDENKWFVKDAELNDYAQVVERQIQREYKAAGKTEAAVGARAHLDEVARRVKLRYADHEAFTNNNPRRSAPNSVRTPGGDRGNGVLPTNGKPRNLQRTYENLPREAKDACDKQIRVMGKRKDSQTGKMVDYYTPEQYCAIYDWPQEFY